ncbi:MAG TPA: CarD family transcriptional regulator, partial [Myxococcales bacterium]|nr:CarD family transcriptional regulator [Myxococcales bacterium]
KNIAGQNWEVVTLSREEDGATVMVPKAKVMGIGLRKVADVAAIDKVFDDLASPDTNPQLDWKVRHRENADRMSGGGLFGTVEVLKGLHALSRVRPLPQKERELYDSARHLLVGEIAAAMNIPLHVAEDNLDYALWPPPGMKRKGRELPPATLGPPAPARAAGDDDDLGFDDEDLAEAEPAAIVGKPGAAEDEEEEPDEEEKPAAAAKKPAAEKAKPSRPAKEKPAAAHAQAHASHAPAQAHASHAPAQAHAPAHPHGSTHAHAPAHPHPATRAAPPPKKAATAKKGAAARKPAAKKAPAKKPAATKAKGKR